MSPISPTFGYESTPLCCRLNCGRSPSGEHLAWSCEVGQFNFFQEEQACWENKQRFCRRVTSRNCFVSPAGGSTVFETVRSYCWLDNDPFGEHDFGSFEVAGHKVIFKIDYFDAHRAQHSPDPADPNVTERVMTIMLASEW